MPGHSQAKLNPGQMETSGNLFTMAIHRKAAAYLGNFTAEKNVLSLNAFFIMQGQ